MKDAKAPLGAYAWTAEAGWIVSPEDVDAMHEEITVVLPVADPDADQPKITDVVGYDPLLAVIRLDRLVTQMLVEMVRLEDRLKAYMAGSADIARKAGKSAAYSRALGDVGDLRAALADVLAFAIQRLGHGDNGGMNGMVVLPLHDQQPQIVLDVLRKFLLSTDLDQLAGCLCVVTENRVRIRRQ